MKADRVPVMKNPLNIAHTAITTAPSAISPTLISGSDSCTAPFGDTSLLSALSLGQQRYENTASTSKHCFDNPDISEQRLTQNYLDSVRQLGECTIQTILGIDNIYQKKERPCLLPPTPLRKVKGLCPLEGSAFPPARAQPLAYIPPLKIGAFLPRGSPFLGLLDLIIDACRAVHKNKE
uniref:Uncharacterized protein n=1 Tax=Timema monikensis TaxID=170555 RepID=A0A7R9EEK6_9NEOP|nr:unnamed protein product [Timema monikensis]